MVDTLRHISIFKPHKINNSIIDIIGLGATGSIIAFNLAKLGLENIRLWDHDIIEEHNIANQLYSNSQIGKYKAEAMHDIIKQNMDIDVEYNIEEVDGTQKMGTYVFLLTDTMESRKDIFDTELKYNPGIEAVIETRMGVDNGRSYIFCPYKTDQVEAWESTLYTDEETEDSACGSRITIGATAGFLANMAVWQFIRWTHPKDEDIQENEVLFSLRPQFQILSRPFKKTNRHKTMTISS